jgi:LysM repeat protein
MSKLKIFVLLSVLFAAIVPTGTLRADTPTAGDLIEAVNALRVNNGLSAIPVDNALMSAAQTQADYLAVTCMQASCNGHIGAGGTYARDRAAAAGYSIAAGMNVVEAWAGRGSSASISDVIYKTWADEDHMGVMLNVDAVAVGAGVSVSEDGFTYYVLDVGVDYGSGGSGANVASTIPTTAVTAQVALVQVATPREDGAIVHIVGSGQALWNIAAAYGVTVDQIKDLNNLKSDIITTGQELVVQLAPTATETPLPTETPRAPTRTPIPAQTVQAFETATMQADQQGEKGVLGMDRQTMGLALILICGAGLALVVLGTMSKEKNKKQPPRQD